jgi:hypothetical protein
MNKLYGEKIMTHEARKVDPFHFRCIHRHSGATHPGCYLKYVTGSAKNIVRLPKVLIFDIETSPLKAYIFATRLWNTNVNEEQVLSEWFALCWSAKWLFSDEIISDRLTGKEARREDDSRIVKSLWKLLNEADIVIAHNGDKFDVPNMNTRFIVNGLPPTAPYQTIDTCSVAKRQFGFSHNNLNALARVFGFKVKIETNFELWKKCVDGDEKALLNMEKYNRRDVEMLEEVYMKIRPWIHSHPNLGLYTESTEPICSNCGSKSITKTDKFYYTMVGKYELFKCECGAYIRVRMTSLSKEKGRSLLVSIAK